MPKTLLSLCCAVAAATVCFLYQPARDAKHTGNFSEAEETQARAQREWMMTHNPATGRVPDNIRRLEQQFAGTIPTTRAFAMAGKGAAAAPNMNWQSRGPVNRGGRTRALAIDVANENIVLAGGQSNGMWRSVNGGQTWIRTTALSAHPSVTCVAQDVRSGKTNTWYYGSGENSSSARGGGSNADYNGDGIFKSNDNGATWSVLPSTANGQPQTKYTFSVIWNMVCDPVNTGADVVYAATESSIQRSADGGATWTAVLESPKAEYSDIAISKTGVLYATFNGDNRGVFRSTDGTNWAKIIPNDFPSTNKRIVIGIAPSNENIVYFFGETPGSGKKLGKEEHSLFKYEYVSGDGSGAGGTWTNRSDNIPAYGGSVGDYKSQESYDMYVKVKPDNPDVVFLGGTNLYRSSDGFASTTNTAWIGGYATANDISQYANHHPDNHALIFLPSNPNIVWTGHDGGISRTNDCMAGAVVWDNMSRGYVTSQFYGIAIDQNTSGSSQVVGGLQDNGSYATWTQDFPTPWADVGTGDGGFAAITDANTFYTTSQNGDMRRYGKTDTLYDLAPPAGATGMLFITPYTLNGADTKTMFYPAGSSMYRAIDATTATKAAGWDKLDPLTVPEGNISALATSTAAPANRLYYGTDNGKVFVADNANAGSPTKKEITGSNFPSGAYVSCVAVDPTNGDKVYVVFSNYGVLSVFASNDGGTNWTNVSGNLEQNPDGTGNGPSCRWITALPIQGKNVFFVGTSTGLYSTENLDGANTVWTQEGANVIGNIVVSMVLSRPGDGMVVVATHAGGIFSSLYASSGVEAETSPAGAGFVSTYPEPFAAGTTVRYAVKTAQDVQITVYDITGRRVQTLVNGRQPEGTHSAEFRPGNLPNGKYMVTLTAGKHHETKLITLAR